MDSEKKIKLLSKEINKLSSGFDHDFVELLEEGVSYELLADTMEDGLFYAIEDIITAFELVNPGIFILSAHRNEGVDGEAVVILDWVEATDENN